MNSSIEEVVTIVVLAGASTVKKKFDIPAGKVLGASTYAGGESLNNPGIVRLGIQNSAGGDVSALQHIGNYRNRDTSYHDGYKPLKMEGGKSYTANIVASEPFTDDTEIDLIFVLEDQDSNCDL